MLRSSYLIVYNEHCC